MSPRVGSICGLSYALQGDINKHWVIPLDAFIGHFTVVRIEVNEDSIPVKAVGNEAGGTCAREGVEDGVAFC
jgi:hypothetical protein